MPLEGLGVAGQDGPLVLAGTGPAAGEAAAASAAANIQAWRAAPGSRTEICREPGKVDPVPDGAMQATG